MLKLKYLKYKKKYLDLHLNTQLNLTKKNQAGGARLDYDDYDLLVVQTEEMFLSIKQELIQKVYNCDLYDTKETLEKEISNFRRGLDYYVILIEKENRNWIGFCKLEKSRKYDEIPGEHRQSFGLESIDKVGIIISGLCKFNNSYTSVGWHIMQVIEQIAKLLKVDYLLVHVDEKKSHLHRLYGNFGFIIVGTVPEGSYATDTYIMKKFMSLE